MQVNNFIQYLENPSALFDVSEKEIKPLLEEFPYCQTGQLMHTVQLNNNNSILFEQQLKKAAAYCTDRNRLFKHIHIEQTLTEKPTPTTPLEVKPVITEVKKEIRIENLDALEKEYLSAAVSTSILLDSENISIEEKEPSSATKTETDTTSEVNLFDENQGHSFSSWLKHYNRGDDLIVGEDNNDQKQISQEVKQDLIDRFIQEDPKIQPKKTNFYSPTNMARMSVVDDSDIVSETLALIYVDQGKYIEAIRSYEKLSLKNQEKSSCFVSQIKILNQKIK